MKVKFRPLETKDLELVFCWRSHPRIYKWARHQSQPLDWDEHEKWFETLPSSSFFYIMEWSGRRVGLVGLDANNRVSIYVGDESATGNKVATRGLKWICKKFADRAPLFAEIHVDNTSSKNLFKSIGFVFVSQNKNWETYKYSI